jgi:hypothetical protein
MMARFFRYIEKVYDWSERIEVLDDSRKKPQIPTRSVFLCAFMMFVHCLASLNAMEIALRGPSRWERIVGKRKASADTIGRVVGLIDSELLRDLLSAVNHQLKRNKALAKSLWRLRFVTMDGHEFFSQ